MPIENVQRIEKVTSIDRWLDEHARDDAPPKAPHPLDSARMKRRQAHLKEWYDQERERQAPNRYQMAIDEDYYDNLQWSEEEANELIARGQAPLVFNETATTVDWILGTEKRTRVDFKVFPRTEDDVETAKAKTDTLKFLSDVNKTTFARSLAFGDAAKVGVGWLEDGARDDPTEEPIFSRYENWRYILWDSLARERDLSDARYLFRIRWTDLDIGKAMFPERRHALESSAISSQLWGNEEEEDFWYLGKHFTARDQMGEVIGRRTFLSDVALVNNRRSRVKLIEAWYRIPVTCRYCEGGEFDGMRFDSGNQVMKAAFGRGSLSLYDRLEMQVRCAMMTERDLLQDMPSPYRHNRIPFTPIWAYKRGRDGMPYGPVRRIRDPQDDLNKRQSKALFAMSTNRVIADADAVEDHDEAREEAARPDMYIIKKRGAEFKVENNFEMAQGHLELLDRDERMIQKSGGVTDENLGRRTNAVSGEAIKARQLQGSVVTAELFSNLRFAIQNQGEMQLSLAEQFITQPKVIRIVGARGKLDWTKINQPEMDAMGNVRFVNDITASQADFVVDEQDFHQSVRQAMFEAMVDLVGKITAVNAEAGLRILRMALEFSDLPNKDEMAGEVKNMLGIVDEGDLEKMTPAQMEEYQAGVAAKREAAEIQRQAALGEAKEKLAKAEKTTAEAQKIRAEAKMVGAEADGGAIAEVEVARIELETQQRIVEAERRAAEAVDAARQEIEKLQAQIADRRAQIQADADAKVKIAEEDGRTKRDLAEKDRQTKLDIADKDNAAKVQIAAKAEDTKREVGKAQATSTEKTDRSGAQLDGALKKLTDQLADLGRKVQTVGELQKRGADAAAVTPTHIIVDSSGKAVTESAITKSVERLASVVEQSNKAARDAERGRDKPRAKEVSIVTPEGKTQTMKVTIKSSNKKD